LAENSWSIGDVARFAGLKPSAVRYYESIRLLPAPTRVSGRRRYDRSVLTRLAIIDVAQRAGFTLAEIRRLLAGFPHEKPPSARWQELAGRKLDEVEALIQRANGMKRLLEEALQCRCVSLEDCDILLRIEDQTQRRLAAAEPAQR